jgi:hypothetical protein
LFCNRYRRQGAERGAADRAEYIGIPEMHSQHPEIVEMSQELEKGRVPPHFENTAAQLAEILAPALQTMDLVIVHNTFTKHFNLPLTAALFRLLDRGLIHHCIAWCHDFTWTSPNSRAKVHPGYPWDLLRTQRSDISYVTVSQERGRELPTCLHVRPSRFESSITASTRRNFLLF